jgi:hypothetical protein
MHLRRQHIGQAVGQHCKSVDWRRTVTILPDCHSASSRSCFVTVEHGTIAANSQLSRVFEIHSHALVRNASCHFHVQVHRRLNVNRWR